MTVRLSIPENMAIIDSAVEAIRLKIDDELDDSKRSDLGQFMTNWNIAKFMSSLVASKPEQVSGHIRILDPGAGVGSLSAALAAHLCSTSCRDRNIAIDAFEVDSTMRLGLEETGRMLESMDICKHKIIGSDFIEAAVNQLSPSLSQAGGDSLEYDYVILNPPYKKISSSSLHKLLLRKVGIEATNLYAAFWHLSILLAKPGAQICAIIPRSFCNGTYFKEFRRFLKSTCNLHHIHVFDSRKDAFSQNEVLQENVIFHCSKKSSSSVSIVPQVAVSRSSNDLFSDLTSNLLDASQVWGDSIDNFIFIPTTSESLGIIDKIRSLPCSLDSLALKVSTGPVVQFRLRQSLSFEDGAPMLYCSSMKKGVIVLDPCYQKSPPFIRIDSASNKWLVSNSCYLIVRRFSSKEEKRRIVCAIYDPKATQGSLPASIGIDNKLNYFYAKSTSLAPEVAYGLYVFLSCSLVDKYYRLVSGHTQVNSGDLRSLKYPTLSALDSVGSQFMNDFSNRQDHIDSYALQYFKCVTSSTGKILEHNSSPL
jgi:adenine-specific DNA-methyltransferase